MGSPRRQCLLALVAIVTTLGETGALSSFAFTRPASITRTRQSRLWVGSQTAGTTAGSFIETQLRGAAMRLHTRKQAPKEGEALAKEQEPYVTTHADYLAFLVDSQHVYEALEEITNERSELAFFRETGLERVAPLEKDIEFMVQEYGLTRPEPGALGRGYAERLRLIKSIPEFVCHYYNIYFAHTAGGRMIGKQMSALLLDKKTLEFYKVSNAVLSASVLLLCTVCVL
jgi:hypothetical protein